MSGLGPPPFDFGEISVGNQAWRQFLLDQQSLIDEVVGRAPFLTFTADPDLDNAQNLGLLVSGYLKIAVAAASATISSVTTISQSDVLWAPISKVFADSGYVASAGQLVAVDATGGVTVIKLPASPTAGQSVIVKKVDAGANQVTIDGNGHNVDGAATQALAAQWNSDICVYTGSQWLIIGRVN